MASKFDGEVMEAMEAIAPMDFNKAKILGEQFEVKPKALIAAAKRAGIAYNVKQRVSKAGGPVVTKEDLVKSIAKSLSIDDLTGLEKAPKTVLIAVNAAI